MAQANYIQASYRLNLNNPKHVEVYEMLEGLNLSIHKSKSNFVVECLYDISQARKKGKSSICDEGDSVNDDLPFSREEIVAEVAEAVRVQLFEEITRLVLSSLAYRPSFDMTTMPKPSVSAIQKATNNEPEAEFDPTLVAMADLYGGD